MAKKDKTISNSNQNGIATSTGESLELTRIELQGMIAPGWKLIEPLAISVEVDEDGQYLLIDEMFSIYGEGNNIADAQQDLITSLIEYYELISEFEDEPSRELLGMIRKYLNHI